MDFVEVRELRYFLAVADELHFGRAAERLHLAQPALSKAIRRLEAKLGVQLLERTSRRVTLTAEGRALAEHGGAAVSAVGAAVRRARRAGRGGLVLAVKSSDAQLARAIAQRSVDLDPKLPAPQVLVSGWGEETEMLHDGRADVALVRSPFDQHGLHVRELSTEPRLVALPADHRLAKRRRVRLAELAEEPRPAWPAADRRAAVYWAAADPPPPGPEVSDLAQLLEVVALGQAIAFLPCSIAERNTRPDLVYRTVTGVSPSVVALAWPEQADGRPLRRLVEAAYAAAAPAVGAGSAQPAT